MTRGPVYGSLSGKRTGQRGLKVEPVWEKIGHGVVPNLTRGRRHDDGLDAELVHELPAVSTGVGALHVRRVDTSHRHFGDFASAGRYRSGDDVRFCANRGTIGSVLNVRAGQHLTRVSDERRPDMKVRIGSVGAESRSSSGSNEFRVCDHAPILPEIGRLCAARQQRIHKCFGLEANQIVYTFADPDEFHRDT